VRAAALLDELKKKSYIESALVLLRVVARYKTRQATVSFYRARRRRYIALAPGTSPKLLAALFMRVLERLSVPFEEERTGKGCRRVRVLDTAAVRAALENPDLRVIIREELEELCHEEGVALARARWGGA